MDAMRLEHVVGMARNGWTASIGIAGRHGPDYATGPRIELVIAEKVSNLRGSVQTAMCAIEPHHTFREV